MAEVSVLIFGLSSYVIVGIILQFTPNGIWKHSTEVGEGEVDSVEEGVGKLSPGSEGSLLVCVLGVGGGMWATKDIRASKQGKVLQMSSDRGL